MNNIIKSIGPLNIDWTGVKRVLVHALLIALGYVVMISEQWIVGHNFGAWEPIVTGLNTILFTFLEKFFSGYNISIDPSTGKAAPIEN